VEADKPTTEQADAGVPAAEAPIAPVVFELEGPLAGDVPVPREGHSLTAKAGFSWVPRPPGSGAARPGLFPVTVEMAPHGRMRLMLESESMSLPAGTEFRARADRYGHVLVWPGQEEYRVLAPGTIRALLQERRADVGQLLEASVEERGEGRLLGVATRRDGVKSPMGALVLEQARLAGVGNSGQLLCRFLLELVLVHPASTVCLADHLPLKAEYTWENTGQLSFVVTLITDKVEIQPANFLTPPRRSALREHALPATRDPLWLDEGEIAALGPDPKAKPAEPVAAPERQDAKARGLRLENDFDSLRFVLVNDALVAFMPPHTELHLERLKPGAYSLVSRDFLGTEPVERWAQRVPGRRVMGAEPVVQSGTAAPTK
jgi:hypothetical protein